MTCNFRQLLLFNKFKRFSFIEQTRYKSATTNDNANHLDKPENPEDDKDRKVPIFTKFTEPVSRYTFYSLEEGLVPVNSHKMQVYYKYPTLSRDTRGERYAVRAVDNLDTQVFQFPSFTDFMCIGSGLFGSAVAYNLKKILGGGHDVLVIDKDPYSTHNITATCSGLLSFQSKNKDHVRISMLSKEILRNLLHDPVITKEDIASLNIRPITHLILWDCKDVDEVIVANEMQAQNGCHVEMKIPRELEETFPWLKVTNSDVILGTHGNQDELIVDPIALRNLYRVLAQSYGANFIQAEMVDYNLMYKVGISDLDPSGASSIVVKLPSGEFKTCEFTFQFLSAGHNTPILESKSLEEVMKKQGAKNSLHRLQPRLRIYFNFRSTSCPLINFPAITDTDGCLLIREDLDGSFRYYLTYEESEKFLHIDHLMFIGIDDDGNPCQNLFHTSDLFRDYFEKTIKPRLVNRIPLMSDAEFQFSFSGFQSYNTLDGSPIVCSHPFYHNFYLSGGYGSRMMSYVPTAALSIAEEVCYEECESFDLGSFHWSRVAKNLKIEEFKSLIA